MYIVLTARLVAAVGFVVFLAGCTADPQPATTAPQPSTTVDLEATTSSTAAAATTVTTSTTAVESPDDAVIGATITIEGFSFGSPTTIEVGQSVVVVNRDAVGHTWTSADGLFESGTLGLDREFKFTFGEAGEYEFFCRIHPSMTGSLTVSE